MLFKTTATTVEDASIWVGIGFMDLADPNPAEIRLADIARALSRLPRFNGHGAGFYSVAEHCLNCLGRFAWHCGTAAADAPFFAWWDFPPRHRRTHRIFTDADMRSAARDVLMHDAAEAYLGDVTTPLKRLLPDYRALEARMHAAVARRFALDRLHPEWVRHVDMELLAQEKAWLHPAAPEWPGITPYLPAAPDGMRMMSCPPPAAEIAFLEAAAALGITDGAV